TARRIARLSVPSAAAVARSPVAGKVSARIFNASARPDRSPSARRSAMLCSAIAIALGRSLWARRTRPAPTRPPPPHTPAPPPRPWPLRTQKAPTPPRRPHGRLGLTAFEQPAQRRTQVVVLRRQPRQPVRPVRLVQARRRRLRQLQVVGGVAALGRLQ